ncbi:hypothetical protein [Methanobrevibacter arboriphilus]|uniref:Uncharacterized protein n=1 Tax=Methanobrevibacter arboriphilus TaxID=39441 RepID=A0ACA8R4X2_METAZ|nr:hypothetical protein [Methanobrevibacter arboriphilus]BBL62646.1 hypothetical protein MarbSA_16860 [Methanobrevibacter arboriphilus]
MEKNKKIILGICIIIVIIVIIAVIAIVNYNNEIQGKYIMEDSFAEELFVNGEKIYTLTSINNMNITDIKNWLNNNSIYTENSMESPSYYMLFSPTTGEFYIIEKSTGILSHSVNKQLAVQIMQEVKQIQDSQEKTHEINTNDSNETAYI